MTVSPPRTPRSDGETTRARILETAGGLFAAHGFADTPNKTIAARAGVDLASINYHFGSRNGLYRAVLAEAHRRLMDIADLQALAQSRRPAAEKLKAIMAHLVASATRHRGSNNDNNGDWHLPVLTAELLAPSPHAHAIFQSNIAAKAATVTGILSELTGLPADHPALQRCLISVVAPALWLQLGHRGVPGPVQTLLAMPREVLIEHLCQFALGGLRAIATLAALEQPVQSNPALTAARVEPGTLYAADRSSQAASVPAA